MTPEASHLPARRSLLRRAWLPLLWLFLLCLFVVTCVPDPISDLVALDVVRVPAKAVPTDDSSGTPMRGNDAFWKISLRGESRWVREVERHQLNGYAEVVRCDDRNAQVSALGPFVGDVPISTYGKGFEGFEPPDQRTIQYDIYVPGKWRYRSEADFNAPMPSHDFDREQAELCIRLGGGSMAAAYGTSNEVRVTVGRRGM